MSRLQRLLVMVTGAPLAFACTPENRQSPRDSASYYQVDVQFCSERLEDPAATCRSQATVTDGRVMANVVAGAAGGRTLQVQMDGPGAGVYTLDPVEVPAGQSVVQWLEITESTSCRGTPCEVAVLVYIDGQLVLTKSVTFL